jgi:membrane fusion protein, multidrug efflux system
MFGSFKAHRVLSVIVLIVAGAWILTGKFAAVGGEASKPPTPSAETAAPTAPDTKRTVAAIVPEFFDHAREIRLFGSTEADKLAVLAARSNGIVASLGVEKGKTIEQGAQVLQLEGSDVLAEVATARAQLAEAAQQLEVGEKLFARGNLAALELATRRATKSAAEAALSQAQASADRLTLQAPFTGLVDSVAVELGEWVQQGAPIATILALDPILIKAEVSESNVGMVKVGGIAKVHLVNGEEKDGTIRHVARQANVQTRTFEVEVALPNPDHAIPSGATAELVLFGAPARAVLVPRSVITLSDDGFIGVRVVGADNKAEFAPVQILDDTEKGMVITGVPDGVKIITAGQDLVRNGDEVIVKVDASATAAVPQ